MHFFKLPYIYILGYLSISIIQCSPTFKVYEPQYTQNLTERLRNYLNNEDYKNYDFVLTNVNEKPKPKLGLGAKYLQGSPNDSPLENPFQIITICEETPLERCKEIENSAIEATNQLKKAINFYKPIVISLKISANCIVNPGENCKKAFGFSEKPFFIALKEGADKPAYSYPQSLAKQLILSDEISFPGTYDIKVTINSSHEVKNFMGVIYHEILHGMGFFGLTTNINSKINNNMDFQEDFYIPNIVKVKNYNGTATIKEFLPMSIYERYIVAKDNPDVYIYDGLLDFYNLDIHLKVHDKLTSEDEVKYKAMIDKIGNCSARQAGRKIFEMLNTFGTIAFKTAENGLAPLQTYDGFYSSSSVCHIEVPFYCITVGDCPRGNSLMNDDIVMYAVAMFDQTLNADEFIQTYHTNPQYGIIGAKTLGVLTTMGWTKAGEPRNSKIYYPVLEEEEKDESETIQNTYYSSVKQSSSGSTSLLNKKNIIFYSFIFFVLKTFLYF